MSQWLFWASGEFSLTNINFFKFDMGGQELCDLGKDGFLDLAPDFVGDILWEHLEQMMRGNGAFSSQTFRFDVMQELIFDSMCSSAACQEGDEVKVLSRPSECGWTSSSSSSKCYDHCVCMSVSML